MFLGPEIEQLSELMKLLSHMELTNDQDKWVCLLDNSRIFSVKSMRKFIEKKTLPSDSDPIRWNSMLPKKVNISSWRLRLNRLPTRVNLDKRGIDLHSTRCPVCDDDQESQTHLFIECKVARELWKGIDKWWKSNLQTCTDVHSLML